MMTVKFEVPQEVQDTHYATSLEALTSAPDYDSLAEHTAAMMDKPQYRHRRESVALMPVIQFVINTTLNTLRDPVVANRVPKEIAHRAEVASRYCQLTTVRAVQELAAYYRNNAHLGPLFKDRNRYPGLHYLLSGTNKTDEILATPACGAFYDASIVMGGALRFLQKESDQTTNEPAARIVSRSSDLQEVAGVPDDDLPRLRRKIGLPYASLRNFERIANGLTFVEPTHKFIRSLHQEGSGCPVRVIPAHNMEQTTVLGQS